MDESALSPVQKEIKKAMEALSEKITYAESILAKKLREIARIEGDKKAGISLNDLETVISFFAENQNKFYALRLNSANDLLINKSEKLEKLEGEARKRRQSSERSMKIYTSSDLRKNGNSTKPKKHLRTERKKINVTEDFEQFEI